MGKTTAHRRFENAPRRIFSDATVERLRSIEKAQGKRRLPRRGAIAHILTRLPPGYKKGVRQHVKLVTAVSTRIAMQINQHAGRRLVDVGLVTRLAQGHDIAKSTDVVDRIREDPLVAKEVHIFDSMGYPTFGKNYRHISRFVQEAPDRWKKMTLEQQILSYADNVCRGVPFKTGEKTIYKHGVYSLKDSLDLIKQRFAGNDKFLAQNNIEFENLAHMERNFRNRGVDIEGLQRIKLKRKRDMASNL
ncbi:MAG: hypothetical protein WCW13_06120 [archaeon]|jgi:hypothetical protein